MADRKQVMNFLEELAQDDWVLHFNDNDVKETAKAALELLKEQEDRISVLMRTIEQMPKPTKLLDVYGDGYAKVVRCKNCKYGEPMCQPWTDVMCTQNRATHIPDWFCADGKRRCTE